MGTKRILIAALAAFAAGSIADRAGAQTIDEVLEKHYQAIGGESTWKDLRSMKATGMISLMNGAMQAPFTMMHKRPDKSRFEFTMQGMQAVHAYDGQTAWMTMPMMGSPEPQRLPADITSQMAEQADLDGTLVGWQEDGHQIELVGTKAVDGKQAYELKITMNTGDVTHYYLDAQTYLPIKWVATRTVQGQESEFVTTLGDYRRVGGVIMPFSMEVDSPLGPQSLTFQSVDVNVPLDDGLFTMPGGSGT